MRRFLLCTLCLVFLAAATVVSAQKTVVPAGNDHWITDPSGTADTLTVPADFFGKGSLPFTGIVQYEGNPRSGVAYDTSVRRENDVEVPGSTSIRVVELYLKSVRPIQVPFADGSMGVCDTTLELSPSIPSKGTININKGDWGSSLTVVPIYTFDCKFAASIAKSSIRTVRDMGTPFMQIFLKTRANQAKENMLLGTETASDGLFASFAPTTKDGVYGAQFSSSKNKWKVENNLFKSITSEKDKSQTETTESAVPNPCNNGCNYILENNGSYYCHCVYPSPFEQIPLTGK